MRIPSRGTTSLKLMQHKRCVSVRGPSSGRAEGD